MSSEIKNSRPQHRGHGPGGGMGAGEKPKDIKKAAKSLVLYSRKYIPAVIIALALAVIGTIFSLIGPNKRSYTHIKRLTYHIYIICNAA